MTSKLESMMALQLKAAKIEYVTEFRFCPDRKWRFDFVVSGFLIAIECEGGIFTNGGHTRGAGYEANIEKYNAAALLGWRVLRFSGDQIESGYALRIIELAIADMRLLHELLGSFRLSPNVLSRSLPDIPAFEKSSRSGFTKLAAKVRRETAPRKLGRIKKGAS